MSKTQTLFVFKKYLYKSTINNSDLIGENIYTYTKFIHKTGLNNI